MTDASAGPAWLDHLAHDLRGPLSPLLTAVNLLRAGRLEPKQHAELLATMERQLEQLAQLIDDTSDLLRSSRGRTVEHLRIDLASVVDMALVRLNRRFADLGVMLEPDIAAPALAVLADPKQLTRLIVFMLQRVIEIAGHGAHLALVLRRDGRHATLRITLRAANETIVRDFAAIASLLSDPAAVHVADAALHDIVSRHDISVVADGAAIVLSLPPAPAL